MNTVDITPNTYVQITNKGDNILGLLKNRYFLVSETLTLPGMLNTFEGYLGNIVMYAHSTESCVLLADQLRAVKSSEALKVKQLHENLYNCVEICDLGYEITRKIKEFEDLSNGFEDKTEIIKAMWSSSNVDQFGDWMHDHYVLEEEFLLESFEECYEQLEVLFNKLTELENKYIKS